MGPNSEDERRRVLAVVFLTVIVFIYVLKTILTFGLTTHLRGQSMDNLGSGNHLICYYTIPNNDSAKGLLPEDVDPFICTHLIIGFAAIQNNSVVPGREGHVKVYQKILALKEKNPSLKVLVSVAEIVSSQKEGQFRRVVSSRENRVKFVKESMKFVTRYAFDGLDLDWEFPSWPRRDEQERRNFSLLLKELRLAAESAEVLLTAAVGAPEAIVVQSYDIEKIAHYVDFINLMSYDYYQYTPNLPMTGPNSPLLPNPKDSGFKSTLNINWSAHYWLKSGMPREKIMIGIPTYGHSFKLMNPNNTGWYAPAVGFGETGEGGFATCAEACGFLSEKETIHTFDDKFQVPYAFNGLEWLSYENEPSVLAKAHYIRDLRFGGAMIFSLNFDDHSGGCGGVKFPLVKEVKQVLSTPSSGRILLA